jgi:hypothetical protein
VPVGVGTPEQYLSCVMDSGSFELLLSSAECIGCGKHRKFNRSLSATYSSKQPDESITTIFGQGKVVSQPIYDRARARLSSLGADDARILCIGDGIATDVAGAGGEGLDCLYITSGVDGARFGPNAAAPDPALLQAFLAERQAFPRYSMGFLG